MTATDLYERRPSWQAAAACRGMGSDIFYPERGATAARAKAICDRCQVRQACADSGLMDEFGVWGGMAQRDRQAHRIELGVTNSRSDRTPICGTSSGHWAHRKAGEKPCDECVAWRRAKDAAAYIKRAARRVTAA